jgi:hypothetical protein
MEAETKISEAAESLERAINMTNGLKDSHSNNPVAGRKAAGTVTKNMVRPSTDDIPGVRFADELKGNVYPKVGAYRCCTSYGLSH